jgi:hypothetical protein
MSYVSPYLLKKSGSTPSVGMSDKPCLSASDVLSNTETSISEKHHALDKLEHEALAAFTMGNDSLVRGKAPAVMLEEVLAARKVLKREN